MSRTRRRLRHRAQYRAHYYTWKALRGFAPEGRDPVNGEPLERRTFGRDLGRAVHIAAARYWLRKARELRE